MDELQFIQGEVLPSLMRGMWVSLKLILPSAFLGVCIGVWVGALRVYGSRVLVSIADVYVGIFRGVPLVVQLFTWYFGLPHLGIYLSPFLASVMGFALCSGAYQSEYVRGALLSIKHGQMLAAEALGFGKWQMVLYIILPQAMRRALPGCGNEIIYLIKYSSLAYMVTCIEMTGEAKILASHYFRYTEVFLMVGLFYLVLVTLAGWGLRRIEARLSLPGFEHHKA